jgi:hypothetical protein
LIKYTNVNILFWNQDAAEAKTTGSIRYQIQLLLDPLQGKHTSTPKQIVLKLLMLIGLNLSASQEKEH